jgi:hypothetical protein
MKSLFKKLGKFKKPRHPSLSNTDAQAVGPSPHELTIITTAADRTPSVPANAATANTQAADATVRVHFTHHISHSIIVAN